MTYSAEVLADSPVDYLVGDDASGTTITDSSGNARDYTAANVTLGAAAIMPTGTASIDFNGTSSQVSRADEAAQRPTSFTIEVWCRPDVTSGTLHALAAKDAGSAGWAFYIDSTGVLNAFIPGGGGSHLAATTISTASTSHVVWTYDNTTSANKVYVNGALDLSFTQAITQTTLTSMLWGVSTGSNGGATRNFWFDGRMSHRAYYPSALSAARVLAHYNAGVTLPSMAGTVTATSGTSGAVALRQPISALPVDAASGAIGAVSAPTPRYQFTPPTVAQAMPGDRLFSRYTMNVGQSVVKIEGTYQTLPYPWLGELTGIEGIDWFLGGRTYDITPAIADALNADGFTTT